MAIEKVESSSADYADSIPATEKKVYLRKNTGDDEITWDQADNNLEILRAKINELIDKVNELDSAN